MLIKYATCVVHAPQASDMPHILDMGTYTDRFRLQMRHMVHLLKYVACVVYAPCRGNMPHMLDMDHLLVVDRAQMQVVVGPNEI